MKHLAAALLFLTASCAPALAPAGEVTAQKLLTKPIEVYAQVVAVNFYCPTGEMFLAAQSPEVLDAMGRAFNHDLAPWPLLVEVREKSPKELTAAFDFVTRCLGFKVDHS